jgi:hypothetical protein
MTGILPDIRRQLWMEFARLQAIDFTRFSIRKALLRNERSRRSASAVPSSRASAGKMNTNEATTLRAIPAFGSFLRTISCVYSVFVAHLFRPFRATDVRGWLFTQGGARRLRRLALPWAMAVAAPSGRERVPFQPRACSTAAPCRSALGYGCRCPFGASVPWYQRPLSSSTW